MNGSSCLIKGALFCNMHNLCMPIMLACMHACIIMLFNLCYNAYVLTCYVDELQSNRIKVVSVLFILCLHVIIAIFLISGLIFTIAEIHTCVACFHGITICIMASFFLTISLTCPYAALKWGSNLKILLINIHLFIEIY